MLPAPPGRFLALDGLRGVAALLVLVFHLYWNSAGSEQLLESVPDAIDTATGLMRSGVAIFFVISGFVIAYTTRNLRTADESVRFIARRQIRLDPPYYVVIGLVLLVEVAQAFVPSLEHRSFTVGQVLLNLIYLQDIVGVPAVLAVAWTLCLEVQFYLVVILIAYVAALSVRSEPSRRLVIICATLGLMAASLTLALLDISTGPWVLGTWWMFGLGIVLAWYVSGWVPPRLVAVVLGVVGVWVIVLAAQGRADPWGGEWFAVATALLVTTLVSTGQLARSPGRTMLYFGRISYSLYLIHLPVIAIVTGPAVQADARLASGASAGRPSRRSRRHCRSAPPVHRRRSEVGALVEAGSTEPIRADRPGRVILATPRRAAGCDPVLRDRRSSSGS